MKNVITKLAGWGIWGLILLLVLSLTRNVSRIKRIASQIESEQAKLAKIEAENAKLEAELQQTKSPEFIEKEVRDKLGLARENEAMVVLPDAETLKKLAPPTNSQKQALPDPNWVKWKNLFF